MGITTSRTKAHWNYFLALERDIERISRYIEISEDNFSVYSLELAHTLFAASSEVDTVAKILCEKARPGSGCANMMQYRELIMESIPEFSGTEVYIPRYGLTLTPWSNWNEGKSPDWWRSYNQVKHERDTHFNQATLKNTLNSMGALLVMVLNYYSYLFMVEDGVLGIKRAIRELEPGSNLLFLNDELYPKILTS
ncbi:hypothetical protein [Pseudomonas pseudonitroreducens]|uniref:hypothetical protein n=1 Tax=Pseudomonas pseudonitroreducens TaxID=2892326 RepID=UPI001F2814F0|nr:hypothetical protein [Pseudomonas pseudonitroreducens]